MYKTKSKQNSKIWKQFKYDRKGNIVGISSQYLERISNAKSAGNSIKDYTIRIRNKSDEMLEIELMYAEKEVAILDGLRFTIDEHELIIFNSAFNYKMHKFAPQVFRDPHEVFITFLASVQKASGKELERLSEIVVANE